IHVCHPDGTSDRCLTTLDNGLPHRHAGSATWSAGGKYLVFTAEKTVHHGGSIEAIPGFGGRSDLWAMRADGSKAWPLTDLPDDRNFGVIIPKFSRDGTRLAWAQRVSYPRFFDHRDAFGDWVVKVADFVDGPGGPRLDHIRTLAPGGTAFYEAYGFSPDGRQIIFCSDFEGTGAFHSQIYVMDAADGSHLRRLTRGNAYNEHASYSPDGRHIVWMTNLDNSSGGCDWWIMDADGSNPRRLTHLNQTGYPDSTHAPVWACLTSWAPDGTQLLGGIQYSLFKQEGRIFLMTLEPALLAK
ncbi:MAG TPA: hypothetical protein VHY09_12930, partial [Candidatus Methylacidiphilales bacterium]|nr:hypothetical protein [Candidatus Methylacidiphilales bacterium]